MNVSYRRIPKKNECRQKEAGSESVAKSERVAEHCEHSNTPECRLAVGLGWMHEVHACWLGQWCQSENNNLI